MLDIVHLSNLDIVEVVLGGLDLPRVALRGILHVEDGALPEGGVVVKAKFGVGSVNLKAEKNSLSKIRIQFISWLKSIRAQDFDRELGF